MKNLQSTIEKFDKTFQHSVYCKKHQEISKEINEDGVKVCVCNYEPFKQFIISEIKELLEGLKGEIKPEFEIVENETCSQKIIRLKRQVLNEREQKLRDDIEEAIG